MPANVDVTTGFSGFVRREDAVAGVPQAALSTCFGVVNNNSQAANNGTGGTVNLWRELFSILAGRTNFRGSAVATNHANVLVFNNPGGFKYLELTHAYSNAIGTTMTQTPKIVVVGASPPVQLNNSRVLRDVDPTAATGFPDPGAGDTSGCPFSTYGMWAPMLVPGYTPGAPEIELLNNSYFTEQFDPNDAANVTPTRKINMDEPVVVYVGGVTRCMVLVQRAATFSATTRSMILGRFTTS